MRQIKARTAVVATAAVLCTQAVWATESGGSTYHPGVENFMVGAAPPPGLYVMEYLLHYEADRLNDNNGNALPIPGGFSVRANAAATRVVWSTDVKLGGGNLVLHGIVPLVNLKVGVAGQSQTKNGVGDLTFGPAIAYHHSPNLHSVLGFDFVAPVGSYSTTNLANIGRNYWSLQPFYTMTHVDPAGFNGDFKATGNINQRNHDTGYKSGTELIVDYSAGWGFGNGWVAGVGGYAYQQLESDKLNGASVADSKGRALAIGPSMKYDNGKGWFITAKWQKELAVRNRPQGSEFWVKTTIPF